MTATLPLLRLLRTAALCILPTLAIVACGGGSSDAPPASASSTVDATGGSVSTASGVSVQVPAGALTSGVTIRVAKDSTGAPALPSATGLQAAGDLIAVTPHGANFSQPVTLTMPLPAVTLKDNEQFALMQAEPGGSWKVIPSQQSDSNLTAQLRTFSFFQIVVISYPVAVAQLAPLALTTVLTCDGQPCGVIVPATTHLRLTVTSNGGQLPSLCDPVWSFATANFDTYQTYQEYTGGAFYKVYGHGAEGSLAGPWPLINDFVGYPPPARHVQASSAFTCNTIQGWPFAREFSPPQWLLYPDDSGISSADGELRVVDWPTQAPAVAGLPTSLRAILFGGPGVASPSNLPTVDDQASVEWQRSDDAGRSWNKVATSDQTDSDPVAYPTLALPASTPWIFWAATHGFTPTLADNGALFRVKACYTDIHNGKTTPSCVTSAYATLNVLAQGSGPTFTLQPRSVLVSTGQTASLAAQVTAQPAASLQWQTRPANASGAWANVSAGLGATTANFTTPLLTPADNGTQFRLLAINGVGSTASDIVTVSVSDQAVVPVITTQPAALAVAAGGQAVFAVNARGTEALSYQWFKAGTALANGVNVSGANSPVLRLAAITSADAASYSVVVSNAVGSATSGAAALTLATAAPVVLPPAIVTQPSAVSVNAGNTATFGVGVSGTGPFQFQWRKDGVAIAGASSAVYTIASTAAGDAANYSVVVGDGLGSPSVTSNAAALSVTAGAASVAPSISTQPSTLIVSPGGGATLAVAASGSGPLSYQWSKDGAPIGGATASVLVLSNLAASDAGSYTVAVTNGAGSAISNAAQLIMVGAPSVTGQPSSTNVRAGQTATFGVGAAGNALFYQWTRNGLPVTGANSSSYQFATTAADDGSVYAVVVFNSTGLVFSAPATLSVVSPYQVTTLASRTGSVGISLPFWNPFGGIAADAFGNVYVVDGGAQMGQQIRRFKPDGTTVIFAGSGATGQDDGPPTTASFFDIQGMAADAAGNLYVADAVAIRKIDTSGNVSTLAGGATAGYADAAAGQALSARFSFLEGIVLDAAGNIYVVDVSTTLNVGFSGIRKLSTDGSVSSLSGSSSTGYVNGPGAQAQFNLGIRNSGGLGIDAAGVMYLMDVGNHVVRKIATDGLTSTFSGDPTYSGTAILDGPALSAGYPYAWWLAMDGQGNAYVGDGDITGVVQGHGVIRKVAPNGDVITVVGGNPNGPLDGYGTNVQLSTITAITLAPDGTIYAIDNNTRLIRIRP